jgi:homoserine O-succinyltransferase
MPLKVEKPTSSSGQRRFSPGSTREEALIIGLINNMPDAALGPTESQFLTLLRAAAGPTEVRLRFSYLPEVKRGPSGLCHVGESYWPLQALLDDPPDALIVTGAEPLAPTLDQEPYWTRLVEVVDWADRHTTSSIWSCLAAHAAVQHLSGIARQRLPVKCCGVFTHDVLEAHPLNVGLTAPLLTPQSRWNDLPIDKLRDAGYAIASASASTGANVFTLQRSSLLVFLQGHPEYDALTLLREYRRDVARFLNGQIPNYPSVPRDYFSESAGARFAKFQADAIARRSRDWISRFPFEVEAQQLTHSWGPASIILYANWLSYIERMRGTSQNPAGLPG